MVKPDTTYEPIGVLLAEVSEALPKIEKRKVPQGFSAFAVDDVYTNVRGLLSERKIVVLPDVVDYEMSETRSKSGTLGYHVVIHVRYTFYGPAGDSISGSILGEGIDYGDKATNKAIQQAVKYLLVQMLQISTGEVDPDAIAPEETVDPRWTNGIKARIAEGVGGDVEQAKAVWKRVADTLGVDENGLLTADQAETALDLLAQELPS